MLTEWPASIVIGPSVITLCKSKYPFASVIFDGEMCVTVAALPAVLDSVISSSPEVDTRLCTFIYRLSGTAGVRVTGDGRRVAFTQRVQPVPLQLQLLLLACVFLQDQSCAIPEVTCWK